MLKIQLAAAAMLTLLALGAAEPQGGVCFRFDDNKSASPEMAKVFEDAGCRFSLAVNSLSFDDKLIGKLKKIAAAGHDVMDHTPSHSVTDMVMPTEAEATRLAAHPGVDHVRGRVVCLKLEVDNSKVFGRFTADVEANRLFNLRPPHKKLRLIRDTATGDCYFVKPAGREFRLVSVWRRDPVNLKARQNVEFEMLNNHGGVRPTEPALKLLIETSRRQFAAAGLPAPVIWIQPGGDIPCLTGAMVRPALLEAGYIGAATYPKASRKKLDVPHTDDEAFRLMWGDFSLEKQSLDEVKRRIRAGLADHRVMIASSHMRVNDLKGGMAEYLELHRELLKWCRENNIPVRTMSEWAREFQTDRD